MLATVCKIPDIYHVHERTMGKLYIRCDGLGWSGRTAGFLLNSSPQSHLTIN